MTKREKTKINFRFKKYFIKFYEEQENLTLLKQREVKLQEQDRMLKFVDVVYQFQCKNEGDTLQDVKNIGNGFD